MKNKTWTILLFGCWAFSQLFDGPIRFAFVSVGMPWLLYTRDAMIGGALVLVCVRHGVDMPLRLGLLALSMAGLAGVVQGRPVGQILIAVKVAIPFLFGLACGDHIPAEVPGRRAWWVLMGAFLGVAGGIFLNSAIEWPWEGMQYAIEGVSTEMKGTKVWSHMGVKRIAGFSRSSYDAAVALAVLAVVIVSVRGRKIYAVPVLLLSAAATVVTTTKGILLNLALVSLDLLARSIHAGFERRYLVPALSSLLVFLIFLFPILSLSSTPVFDTSSDEGHFLLKSMNDRLESSWPEAFELIIEEGNLLTGRGLGGLGVPQTFFEAEKYNPCDNMLVFLLGNYGIFSAFFLPLVAWKVVLLAQAEGTFAGYVSLSGLLILSYGVTANVLESPFLGMLVGLIVARGDRSVPRLGPA
jgi:hypothetical protein